MRSSDVRSSLRKVRRMPLWANTPLKLTVGATKTEVRKAVEQLFDVKVLKVNTANYDGKTKRQGVHVGLTASWKKLS